MQRTRAYYDWGQRPYSLTCLSVEQQCVSPARTREISFNSLTVSRGHAAHFMVSFTHAQSEVATRLHFHCLEALSMSHNKEGVAHPFLYSV